MRDTAREIIKRHIRMQGCEGDDFQSLALMQPMLFDWIILFGFTEEDLK